MIGSSSHSRELDAISALRTQPGWRRATYLGAANHELWHTAQIRREIVETGAYLRPRSTPGTGGMASDQPFSYGADCDLAAGGRVEFGQDGRHMVGNGAVTDEQFLTDLPV